MEATLKPRDQDSHWTFLHNFYKVVISEERWPQNRLRVLRSGFERILATVEIAWLKHEKHLNWQQHRKHRKADADPLVPTFCDYHMEEYFPLL